MATQGEKFKNIAARAIDALGSGLAIVLLVAFVLALALGFINSCVDTPDMRDDFGLFVDASYRFGPIH
jgi:hypothetical protein